MNRRDLFRSFIKGDHSASLKSLSSGTKTTALGIGSGLNAYSGTWGYDQAKHLLKRAMFGPTHAQILQAIQDGLSGTLVKLFSPVAEPAPPVNYNFPDDPACPIGQSWVNAVFNPLIKGLDDSRRISLAAWQMGLLLNEGVSIKEKMTLFWYNHFVTETLFDSRSAYNNIKLYRQNALGNFKEFTKKVTIDPGMLRYLNGNQNTKNAPNENYARELLELFTVGKGPIVGAGDYTTFTEKDVEQMAKILTGWVDFTNESDPNNKITALFLNINHDTSSKTLSHRFNNIVVPNMGNQEYANLVDIIFEHPELPKFIARKLYRWFIYYVIDDNIEQNVIQPMADMLVQENFEIEPVVEALLKSEHFFDPEISGCMIKSPLDHLIGALKMFDVKMPANGDYAKQYKFWETIFTYAFVLQQAYFFAPNVAGWKPYYQAPAYYQLWINSVTLPIRIRVMDALATVGAPIDGTTYKIDVLKLAKSTSDPTDPLILIEDIAKFIYPKPLSTVQKAFLKGVLLPGGLPDYVWTAVWGDYINNPNDPGKVATVEQLLRGLLYTMCDFSEFQLS